MKTLPKSYSDTTKDGRKLAFKFTHQKDPYDFNHSGYIDMKMEALMVIDGQVECVGDLKLTYLPTEALQAASKDALLFADRHCNWYLDITQEEDERDSDVDTSTPEGKIEALRSAKRYFPDELLERERKFEELASGELDDLYTKIQQLTWARPRVKDEKAELEIFSICPGIRFINVEEGYQRQGIATALYKATALTLGLNDLKLRRGRTRCDNAKLITPEVLEGKGFVIEQKQWPGDSQTTEYIDGVAMLLKMKERHMEPDLEP